MKILLFFFIGLINFSCSNQNEGSDSGEIKASNKTGEELAKLYCGNCHTFPNPKSLPKEIWLKNILPKMALRLGIGNFLSEMSSIPNDEMMILLQSDIYPQVPTIHADDWEKITEFYKSNAPDSLISNSKNKTELNTHFEVLPILKESNNITMTKFDEATNSFNIADSQTAKLTEFKINGEIKISKQATIVDFGYHKNLGKVFLEIGQMNPTDVPLGKLIVAETGKILLKNLQRPVNLEIADINNDGIEDFLICSFGNMLGNLSWFNGKTLKQEILSTAPGARKTYFVDFDGDGKKDILALMTQGKEQIILFKNNDNGYFTSKPLIDFPSYFGSSYFELNDIDKDGDLDIIYTNGDNADLSRILKSFHGVRIFENQNGKFKQQYFFPINGASKVLFSDLDNDGDDDFAIISFFPKRDNNEGFVILNNQGNLNFKSQYIKNISNSKWLTMDIADFDEDGDKDIILGNYNNMQGSRTLTNSNSLVILKNLLKK